MCSKENRRIRNTRKLLRKLVKETLQGNLLRILVKEACEGNLLREPVKESLLRKLDKEACNRVT